MDSAFIPSLLIYITITISYLILSRNHALLNPALIFIFVSLVDFIGFSGQANPNSKGHVAYSLFAPLFLVLFALGAASSHYICSRYVPAFDFKNDIYSPKTINKAIYAVIVLNVISLLITLLYINSIGGHFMMRAIREPVGSDVAGMRLMSYAGSSYFAPGYVNQFKNVILPATSLIILVFGLHQRIYIIFWYGVLSVLVSVFGLVATGQRQFLLYSVVALTPIAYWYLWPHRAMRIAIIYFGTFLFALFVGLSVMLGRTEGSGVFGAVFELVDRMSRVQATGTIAGMHSYWPRPPDTFLVDWIASLENLLPGKGAGLPGRSEGVLLANEINAFLYGTTRGTSPLSIWASVWYNLGVFWGSVFSIFWGCILGSVRPLVLARPLDPIRAAMWGVVVASLGGWVAGGPSTLFNTGLAAGIFMLLVFYVVYSQPQHRASR